MRSMLGGSVARKMHLSLALFAIAAATGITVAGCRAATSAAPLVPKRIVDLSPPITPDLAVRQLGHRACEFLGIKKEIPFKPVVPANKDYAFGLTTFELVSHLGAHLDAPGRLLKGGERADQVDLEKLYGRAQVIDLRWKDRHTPLQITDLDNYEIEKGRVLILYVGYQQPGEDDWPTYSPISVEAARWLANKEILALATDMPSIGSFSRYADLMEKDRPPQEVWAERLEFSQAGIPVVEGLTNLGSILKEENVVFIGFPLAIADRSGAPMRAAALVY
ncbi:MAG TPA: cyclase family protein [Terriglobales bacterium]|nr:cyclase family protein [Terriglobales bacterium]